MKKILILGLGLMLSASLSAMTSPDCVLVVEQAVPTLKWAAPEVHFCAIEVQDVSPFTQSLAVQTDVCSAEAFAVTAPEILRHDLNFFFRPLLYERCKVAVAINISCNTFHSDFLHDRKPQRHQPMAGLIKWQPGIPNCSLNFELG